MFGICERVMSDGNSNERLMIFAPWSAAKRMPCAIRAESPSPSRSSTFTGISFAPYASPVSPTALPVPSAIVPATCVPWPLSSLG